MQKNYNYWSLCLCYCRLSLLRVFGKTWSPPCPTATLMVRNPTRRRATCVDIQLPVFAWCTILGFTVLRNLKSSRSKSNESVFKRSILNTITMGNLNILRSSHHYTLVCLHRPFSLVRGIQKPFSYFTAIKKVWKLLIYLALYTVLTPFLSSQVSCMTHTLCQRRHGTLINLTSFRLV